MSWLSDLIAKHPELKAVEQELLHRVGAIEAQNHELAERNEKLEGENARLLAKLQGELPGDGDSLSADARAVLEAVHKLGDEDVPIDAVAQHLKMAHAKAKLTLRKLDEAEYVFARHYMNRDAEYCLADRGTEYLIETGVIK